MRYLEQAERFLSEAEGRANQETDRLADAAMSRAQAQDENGLPFLELVKAFDDYQRADRRRAAIATVRNINSKLRKLLG